MKKIYLILISISITSLKAQITVTPGLNAATLAQTIAGPGLTISNAVLNCGSVSSGTFSSASLGLGNIGIGTGVLLTTGRASDAKGPAASNTLSYDSDFPSYIGSNASDADLYEISEYAINNTCKLEFDLIPLCSNLEIKYVFASEEYPEYVCSQYNDAFGFFISGPGIVGAKNIATIPTTTIGVAINSINSGFSGTGYLGSDCKSLSYSYLFVDNSSGPFIQYDGFTTPLTAATTVTPCLPYHLKLVIADGSDRSFDSGVFLQQNGITCANTPTVSAAPPAICAGKSTTLTIKGTAASSYSWTPNIGLSTTTGSIVVASPTTTTIYTVTTSYGCSQLLVQTVTVTVKPLPILTVNSPTICSGTSTVLTVSGGTTYSWTPSTYLSSTTASVVTSTPTGPIVYTVTGTTNGCSSIKTSTISISATPTVAISSISNPTICSGNTTVITPTATPTGAFTYTLINTGQTGLSFTVNPIVTTTYSIIGVSAAGCKSINTTTTVIKVNPTPTLSILSVSSPSICNGSSTVITPTAVPTGASSYTLLNTGATGTSFTVNPSTTTTYSIIGTSSFECPSINTATTTITVYPIPVTIASTTGSVTCINNIIALNSTLSGAGITYTWTAPLGSSIIGSPYTQNTTGQGLGTYSLNVKGPGGCAYSTTVAAIQNTTTPISVDAGLPQSLICGVLTVTLTGSATPTTATANWLGGVTNPTSFTTTTGSAGTYTLQAVDPITGCTIESTVSVVQSIDLPAVTANPVTFSITCTNSIVPIGIVVTSTNPVTYQWSTTGISGSTTNSTATATLAGVYNVTVTNNPGNNCSTVKSITVPFNITPVIASITPAATITCSTPSLTLNANPGGAIYTYSWTGTSPILSGGTTQNPIINNGGIYSVAITNTVNGCVGFANISVASSTNPPVPTLSANSVSITCSVPTPSILVTTSVNPVSFVWTPTLGIVSGTGTTSSPSFSLPGTYSVVLIDMTNGCSSITKVVKVDLDNAIPVITLAGSINSGSLTCSKSSITTTANVTPLGNLTYTWTNSSGISSSVNQAAVTFTAAGVYTVVVTNTLTGCVSSSATPITFTAISNTVAPILNVVQTSTNSSIGCGVNSSISYSVNSIVSNGSATYLWSPTGGSNQTFTTTVPGTYSVLVIDAVNNCSNTAQFTVSQNTISPSLTAAATVTTPCGSTITVLSASSSATNVSFSWTGPSNAVIIGSSTSSPTVNLAGNYIVTVMDAVSTCTRSAIVNVLPTVVTAAFTANPTTGIAPLLVNFTNQSTGATSYSWNFGNNSPISTYTNTNTTYTTGGNYVVTLTAFEGNCVRTSTTTIIVYDDFLCTIPNVFTPNGDGVNDVFSITCTAYIEMSLTIFNRWGTKLYDYTGSKAQWDGKTAGGESVVDGTYFFIAKIKGAYDNKEVIKNGSVSLFR